MCKFTQSVVEFLRNEDGPTAVEYAVMLALIIVVCIDGRRAVLVAQELDHRLSELTHRTHPFSGVKWKQKPRPSLRA
jgi:Flp pilus assembly pilin Flp